MFFYTKMLQTGQCIRYNDEIFNTKQADQQGAYIELTKGKALGKHSLHEKTAASVLLRLFISGNE